MTLAHIKDRDLVTFFDTLAARWDSIQPPDRDAHLARLLAPHAAMFARARRVLDVGTGTGAFLPHLTRLAPQARVTGIDLSGVMLHGALSNGRAGRRCCWMRADAHDLPFAVNTMDLVTCHDSFAHFEDPARALREFRRVLCPGGSLLILHDISRNHVNAIHTRTGHSRVRTHLLPPVADLIPVVEAAGFTVTAAADAADHYLLAAC